MAMKRLQKEYKDYIKNPNEYYSIEIDENNFFKWNILIFGPQDSIYEYGIFECEIIFNNNYPNKPPELYFLTNILHPNIYKNGKVCMSILHEGQDITNYEHISERWNPSHSVNTILMSLINLLLNPNFESSANLEATKLWLEDYDKYKEEIYKIVSKTQK
jgi:ubiquitin-protein ligase